MLADVEGVESDGEGGFERVESIGEGNLGGVQADRVGVCATGIEVDECDGVEMDNVADEDADDFSTSDGVDNVAAASSGEEDDRNEIEDEHHCSVSLKNKMVTAAMVTQHFEATIKDHPKMKLREIQRRCPSKIHVNVTIDCCYRVKKIVKEKMAGNHKEEFGLLWDYAHELKSKMLGSTKKWLFKG
ncbi:hypothetical protein GOBAR_DD15544 [Gossypium barbadense]|nr:hypothetical protein GOBAR_DD15544 [Gossypium barbadense]